MWISSAPLRVSLAGGGTDLPTYARRFGGAVLGTTMNLRTTVIGRPGSGRTMIRACLDSCVNVASPQELPNPFAKEALRSHWDGRPISLTSDSDVRSGGTGLGSSAAFLVALLGGLVGRSAAELAEAAAVVEIEALKRPVGRQDHYLSALGGFHFLRFATDGTVETEHITPAPDTVRRLSTELMLFATGVTRNAGTVLAAQDNLLKSGDARTEARLHEIKELTAVVRDALVSGATSEIGAVLGRHWEIKRNLSTQVTSPAIDHAYQDGLAAGATGGKLLGAGGGGYLLMHVPELAQANVRTVFATHAMHEQPFCLDDRGHEITRIPDEESAP